MDDVERALQTALSRTRPSEESVEQAKREESVGTFERKVRMIRWVTWFFLVVDILAMGAAAVFLQYASDARMMIWCAILFVVAFEGTILIKLWYWIVTSKISVLKELKRLEMLLVHERRENKQ